MNTIDITIIYIYFYFYITNKIYVLLLLLQGEYRLVYEKLYPCQSSNIMQCNMYLNKKTLSINEVLGNVTFLLPLDDTLIVSKC